MIFAKSCRSMQDGVTSPNNGLNGSAALHPTFPVLGCHDFCGKWEEMQEQKSRQPAGGKSSFSPNALGEITTLI